MEDEKPKLYRRCKCHKYLIGCDFDTAGNVTERHCVVSRETIKPEDTYWATFTDPAEIERKEEPKIKEIMPVYQGNQVEMKWGKLENEPDDFYESGEWMG